MNDPLSEVLALPQPPCPTSWQRRALLIALLVIAGVSSGGCGSNGGPHAAACDLAAQTGCAAGEKCTFACGAAGGEIACVPDGTLAVGAACPDGDLCGAGSWCASRAADPTPSCRAFCATDADCASGTCTQLPISICGTKIMAGICG